MKPQLFGLFFGSLLSATVSAAGGAINPVLDDPFTFKLGADFLKADGTFSSTIAGNRTVKISMKWSTNSGHRVKAVKCHNEVSNDNRNEKETGVHGRFQAGCSGAGYRTGLQAL